MLQAKLWQKVVVSYPLMFYTGVTPDCRQIVVANLADTKQPQRILTLPNDQQLQNMGNSNTHDRIYFQAFKLHQKDYTLRINGFYVSYVYGLVYQMPFIRNRHHHQHHIYIRQIEQHLSIKDMWHKDITRSISMDYVCHDPTKLDSCLVQINQTKDTITIGAYNNHGYPIVSEVIQSSGVVPM